MKQPIRRDDLIAELQKFPNDEVLIMCAVRHSNENVFNLSDAIHTYNIRAIVAEPYHDASGEAVSESAIVLVVDD